MDPSTAPPETIDEAARRAFEAAWRAGRPEPIDHFLPPPGHPFYLTTCEELVHIELEFAWKARGRSPEAVGLTPPVVEHYLARYPRLGDPAALLRLLRQEFRVRQQHGDQPAAGEYARRFPGVVTTGEEVAAGSAGAGWPRVADYDVFGRIGEGGMGVVYQARQPGLDRVVAIKTIRGRPGAGPERERFLAEARTAARLEHPGVVPVHDVGEAPDVGPYYAMKLVRGQTLDEAIRGLHAGGRPAADAGLEGRRLLTAFVTIARTVAFAHARGVIHRDLKPANVVLGEYGETVILDWGLAKELRRPDAPAPDTAGVAPEATLPGSVLGTPAYMPPEQAAGDLARVNELSDVYALGAILYQVLTGRPPFVGPTSDAVLKLVLTADPPRPRAVAPHAPRALEAVCLRALAKRPEHRYPAAAALADDVERYLAGEPVGAYREPWVGRAARWARRHRTGVAAGAVTLVLLTAGAVAGLFLWQEGEHRRATQEAEFERTRREARTADLRGREQAAREDERLAAAELRADRFASAERILRKAAAALRDEPDLADALARVRGKWDRARRVAEFYRLADRAERLAVAAEETQFGRADEELVAACGIALDHLGVLARPGPWWEHLPGDDLRLDQRDRLRAAAAAVMGLRALWLTKSGLLQSINPLARLVSRGDSGAAYFHAARVLLGHLQADSETRYKARSSVVEALDLMCRYGLGERGSLHPVRPEPLSAAEAYFLGILHLFLGHPGAAGLTGLAAGLVPADLRRLSGLDFDAPLRTAVRMLRMAVALDPGHYWSHFMLAMSLAVSGDAAGAEQAFNACVGLRPDYLLGYTQRAALLLIENGRLRDAAVGPPLPPALERHPLGAGALVNPVPPHGWGALIPLPLYAAAADRHARRAEQARAREELGRRAARGLEQGLGHHPHDPLLHWLRGAFLGELGDRVGSLAAFTAAAESEAARRLALGPPRPADARVLTEREWGIVADRALHAPDGVEERVARALAYLTLGKFEDAARAAGDALTHDPRHPRALAARGAAAAQAGRWTEALADFEAALALAPDNALAAFGRVRALERSGDWPRALVAADRMLAEWGTEFGPGTAPDWRHLGAHLARARALARLGRPDDAREAVERAGEIDPEVAAAVSPELTPPAAR